MQRINSLSPSAFQDTFFERPRAGLPRHISTTGAKRRGLTLIEMLVAVTITLMVILAIVQVFQLLGTNIKNGQALIESLTSGDHTVDDSETSTQLGNWLAATFPNMYGDDGVGEVGALQSCLGERRMRQVLAAEVPALQVEVIPANTLKVS